MPLQHFGITNYKPGGTTQKWTDEQTAAVRHHMDVSSTVEKASEDPMIQF